MKIFNFYFSIFFSLSLSFSVLVQLHLNCPVINPQVYGFISLWVSLSFIYVFLFIYFLFITLTLSLSLLHTHTHSLSLSLFLFLSLSLSLSLSIQFTVGISNIIHTELSKIESKITVTVVCEEDDLHYLPEDTYTSNFIIISMLTGIGIVFSLYVLYFIRRNRNSVLILSLKEKFCYIFVAAALMGNLGAWLYGW